MNLSDGVRVLRFGHIEVTPSDLRQLPSSTRRFGQGRTLVTGQPQQNAYIERYNRTVQHEWLDQYIIESIDEAQDFAMQWLWTYKNDHPNMGIGCITPAMKLKLAA